MNKTDVVVRTTERSVLRNAAYEADPSSVARSSWTAFVPALHRVLANPQGSEDFPVPRRSTTDVSTTDDLFTHCAYWEAAVYLLVYILGWRVPAAGLRWWYEAGQPTEDLRLAVLKELWGSEGQLDLLTAWLWSGGNPLGLSEEGSFQANVDALVRPFSVGGTPLWRGHSPYGGGTNPLHLGYSNAAEQKHGDAGTFLRSGSDERQAVLVLDSAAGWYYWLAEHGVQLPALVDRSWRVEVIVRPIGSLGIFRRSRVTGLWFQGRHSIHIRGNIQAGSA